MISKVSFHGCLAQLLLGLRLGSKSCQNHIVEECYSCHGREEAKRELIFVAKPYPSKKIML
jgi:hypothetical protein